MKFLQYSALFAIVAFALSISAFAKDNHSGKFTLSDPVQIGSMQLAPGAYKAEWTGPANDVKVDIIRHGKTVATTEGKIQEPPEAPQPMMRYSPRHFRTTKRRWMRFNSGTIPKP